MTPPISTIALVAGVLVLCSSVLGGAYYMGHSSGEDKIRLEWADAQLRASKEKDALVAKIGQMEQVHREETDRIKGDLSNAKSAYEKALGVHRAEFTSRLQLSEQRASRYQRQAKGSDAERADLASHTAKLDRALEEGRGMVKELRDTLELRERQLRSLGEQLTSDRQLMSD